MQGLELTDRILRLLEEAEKLCPEVPISFRPMDDPTMIARSAGAAMTEGSGVTTVYVDPLRANEYMIAHELMHVILHRQGLPGTFYLLFGLCPETPEQYIANAVDNCFDHYEFDPRLDEHGFDSRPHKEWFVSEIGRWPTEKERGRSILTNAFIILDGLLFGPPYREALVKAAKSLTPRALGLARSMEGRIVESERSDFVSRRQAMIAVLDYLSRWVTKESGQELKLRKLVGVTPQIDRADWEKPAGDVFDLVSHSHVVTGRPVWLLALQLRLDNARFHAFYYPDCLTEPREAMAVREQWHTCDVDTFLTLHGIWRRTEAESCRR